MLAPIEDTFYEIDDFCKEYYTKESQYILPNPERQRIRLCRLSASEIMTILILFHLSHYRTFKDYYHECGEKYLTPYFPEFLNC